MSRDGIGTVQCLSSGRWRARLPPRLGKVTVGTYDTEKEAATALAAALRAADTSSPRTLRAWGEIWFGRRAQRGLSSFKDEVCRWEQHVLPSALADREVRSIQPRDVAAFTRWLSTRPRAVRTGNGYHRPAEGPPISRGTQRLALEVLRLALRDAAIEGWCSVSPASQVRVVKGQEGPAERRHLTPAMIAQLLGCEAVSLAARRMYAVALYTGLRPGELWALRWSDIHLGDRPHIRVRRAVKRDGSEGPPKSKKGNRTVPLLPQALDALRAMRPGAPGALVFPAAGGEQRKTGDPGGWADRRSGKKCKRGNRSRAGLPADLDLYSLRHTCCTALLYGWWGRRWSLVEVRAWMGHSSVAVTQIYLHDDEDGLLDAAADHAADHAPGRQTPSLPVGSVEGQGADNQRILNPNVSDGKSPSWSVGGRTACAVGERIG
jgi:integrase